jgi:putative selenium metabolism hydrolase
MLHPDNDTIVARLADTRTPDMVRFLRDMIAIPSESAGEEAVVQRVAEEMRRLCFDEVRIDGLGNVLGRVGSGRAVIAIDGHLDTVGVGDPSTWHRDPYSGELENGIVYGRGASDQEAGVAAAVHGAAIAKESALLEDVQLWVTGTVIGGRGLCSDILNEHILRPMW